MKKLLFDKINKLQAKLEKKLKLKEKSMGDYLDKSQIAITSIDYLISSVINRRKAEEHEEPIMIVDDYYYENEFDKEEDNHLVLVAAVGFHHKKGSIIEYIHPDELTILNNNKDFFNELLINCDDKKISIPNDILTNILNQLTTFCLPDAVHTTNEDAQFFLIQNFKTPLFGTSCYRQIKTSSIILDNQNSRECIQKVFLLTNRRFALSLKSRCSGISIPNSISLFLHFLINIHFKTKT